MRIGDASAGRDLAARLSCAVLLAVVPFLAGQELRSQSAPQPMTGQQAPDFALAALDGKIVRLSDYRGKFVVVHFAADW